ncbi:hypothetical protein ACFLZZ_03820 [Nanoarchaeota archaeon]
MKKGLIFGVFFVLVFSMTFVVAQNDQRTALTADITEITQEGCVAKITCNYWSSCDLTTIGDIIAEGAGEKKWGTQKRVCAILKDCGRDHRELKLHSSYPESWRRCRVMEDLFEEFKLDADLDKEEIYFITKSKKSNFKADISLKSLTLNVNQMLPNRVTVATTLGMNYGGGLERFAIIVKKEIVLSEDESTKKENVIDTSFVLKIGKGAGMYAFLISRKF